MKKRNKRLAIWLVRLLIVAVFVFVFANPSSRLVIFGLLRGERFYGGKPTSHWRLTLEAEKGQLPQPTPPSYLMGLIKSLPFFPQDDQPYLGAFWELSNADRSVIPVLIQLLKDDDPEIRRLVLVAIDSVGSRLGPAARHEAAPALLEALNDPDESVRLLAALALSKVSPENREAVPVLIETLKEKQNPWRTLATSNLGVPLLFEVREDQVIWALGQIGPDAKEAVPELRELLKRSTDDDSTQYWVIWALGQIGPDAREAVPELRELLKRSKDGDWTQYWVIWALGQIGPDAKEAVPELRELLKRSRSQVIWALGQIGPGAKEAIPDLRELLKDDLLHQEVQEALDKIDGVAARQ